MEKVIRETTKFLRKDLNHEDNDKEMNDRIALAGFIAYQQAKQNGVPIARYDAKKKVTYLLYPDGRREDVRK